MHEPQLVIKADYGAVTKSIITSAIFAIIMIVFTAGALIPIDEFRLYSKGSNSGTTITGTSAIVLSLVFGTIFILGLLLFVSNIPNAIRRRRELPVIYSFTKRGFRSHLAERDHVWEDFENFFYSTGGLHLPLKNDKRGTRVVLSADNISKKAYQKMIHHIKEYAPKHLTSKVKAPKH